jgi:hypothetical protein
MCCFSRNVRFVADTNIFARPSKGGRQFLVYSMKLGSAEDLAMILPIPTPTDADEDAVKFINLEKYPEFFTELLAGFPVRLTRGDTLGGGAKPENASALKVVEVGSFIASFVPSLKDFGRLDEQFRLPAKVWDKLPQYKNWGFAVFKLKKGEKKVHPMAFEFPRANNRKLFFPTVHIHDRTVPEKAKFDHMLFAQFTDIEIAAEWEESRQPAEMFMKKLSEAQGIVAAKEHVYRKVMKGQFKNADVIA